jgi:hypothetical protein
MNDTSDTPAITRATPEKLPPLDRLQRDLQHAEQMTRRAKRRYHAATKNETRYWERWQHWRAEVQRLETLIDKRHARAADLARLLASIGQ